MSVSSGVVRIRRFASQQLPSRLILLLWLAAVPARAGEQSVVLLVFDGFAPEVVERFETPALDRMRREGAWSHHLVPAFPTISLINGVTLSTGCWPARHGVVTNKFLDPDRGLYDHSPDADWLLGCEHLHQVAERQGVPAAALAWYGAHSETRGPLARYVEPPGKVCNELLEPGDRRRADEVVRLLGLPAAERPRLLLAYFCGPDGAEHFTGTASEETRLAVEQSDAIIGRVMEAIEALPDAGRFSVIVTTDHGMRDVTHVVNIERILRRHGIDAEPVSTGTTSFLYLADPTRVDAAFERLSRYDEFEVLRPDALPAYARLGNGERLGHLIVSARPPYFIEDLSSWPGWLQWLGRWGPDFLWARISLKASHGYPPDVEGMHGIFYAWGAGIARGRELDRVRNVDVHPTVTHLLGIEPGRPVDGVVERGLLVP